MSKISYNSASFNGSLIKGTHNVCYGKIFILGEWPWPKNYNSWEIEEYLNKNLNFWMTVTFYIFIGIKA